MRTNDGRRHAPWSSQIRSMYARLDETMEGLTLDGTNCESNETPNSISEDSTARATPSVDRQTVFSSAPNRHFPG